MYERLESCPVCKGINFKNSLICKDYTVSHESFVIVECESCSFKFTNPRPQASELGKFYESIDYISHSSSSNSIINILYKVARRFTLKRKLKLIDKLTVSSPPKLLDFGCGTGGFLQVSANNDWEAYGIEPNENARIVANNNDNCVVVDHLDQLNTDSFDVITLWHVLEHIPDVNSTIGKLKALLKSKGRLVVAVPNNESWDALKYKEQWAAYDVPRHLYHFTQDSIRSLLKNHKLKVEAIVPMKLDSYYVSLLSEKYKKQDGKSKGNIYINSFINGYKSNRYAKKHNNNYSSLIYIIKK